MGGFRPSSAVSFAVGTGIGTRDVVFGNKCRSLFNRGHVYYPVFDQLVPGDGLAT